MRSKRLQREVDELIAQGWKIEDEDRDRVVMIDREYGSLASHVLVALLTIWWTMGIGNVLWGAYNYVARSERRVLWEGGVGCSNCGANVPENAEYCPACGTGVASAPSGGIACPDCDAVVSEGSRYCRSCGTKLADALLTSTHD